MIVQAPPPGPGHVLAVGDPRRPAIGRAVVGTLLAAVVFFLCTGPVKQIAPLYDHAPWLNDPFDTAVSFAMFFVPLVAACCLARVPLCRKSEPLPAARVRDLLRGCRVVLGAVAVTLLAEWVSVVIGANRAQWNGATWLQVGLLVLMTVLTLRAAAGLRRVPVPRLPDSADRTGVPDWLTDMVAIAARESRWLGPFRRPVLSAVGWTDRRLLSMVRRHPLRAASVVAVALGVTVGAWQGVSEGYDAPVMLTFIALFGCGMFALLAGAGSYLGFVRGAVQLRGIRRRAADAAVVTCAGVLVAFAFRYHLWWIVGSSNAVAGLPQLLALLGISALSVFAVALALESLRARYALRGITEHGTP